MPVSRNKRARIRVQMDGSVANCNSFHISTHETIKQDDKKVRVRRRRPITVGVRYPIIDGLKDKQLDHTNMEIKYVGDRELEGIITSPVEVIVHAYSRANLIRKAERVLYEKYGLVVNVRLPKPSSRIEGIVL